ncbi:MAG: twin-arginine translocation signal domain-containing protein [Opitutaceae bacterium]|nr:twin-arginine translocation signal domain-containing protein [Opitutaceae bacterium]
MSTSTTNRRDFLKQGTIGTAGVSIGAMGFADRKLDFQGDRIREGFSGGITPSRNLTVLSD